MRGSYAKRETKRWSTLTNKDKEKEKKTLVVVAPNENKVKPLTRFDIKEKVNEIFNHYAKYSDDGVYYISQFNVNKILKESSLTPENPVLVSEIDILFRKVSSSNKKSNKSTTKLNKEQFLNFLVKLVVKMYPNEFRKDRTKTVNTFFVDFFSNYDNIVKREKREDESVNVALLFKYKPDNKQKLLLKKINPTLKGIYEKYFLKNLNKSTNGSKAELSSLISFAKDFEIFPYIMNQSQLIQYYTMAITNILEKKQPFSFNKFSSMIVHFATVFYNKNIKTDNHDECEEMSEVAKLLLFLEMLENSKGMKNYLQELNKPTGNKISFIPDKKALYDMFGINDEGDDENGLNDEGLEKNDKPHERKISFDNIYKGLDNNVLNEIKDLLTQNSSSLLKTFLNFCRVSDKLNYNQMTISGYLKFVRQCKLIREGENELMSNGKTKSNGSPKNGLKTELYASVEKELPEATKKYLYSDIQQDNKPKTEKSSEESASPSPMKRQTVYIPLDGEINENEIDIIFSKTTKSSFRMNYIQFLSSFQYIAEYAYKNIDLNVSLVKTLRRSIIPHLIQDTLSVNNITIDSEIGLIQFAFAKLKKQNIKTFLKKLALSLVNYYRCYCDERNNMNFSAFFNFFKDFDLFPDMINLVQMRNLFYFLSHYDELNNPQSKQILNRSSNSNDIIIFTNLVEAIAVTAVMSDFEENYDDIDRLIYTIEKMNNSKGETKCITETGYTYCKTRNNLDSFLNNTKKEYPDFYNLNKNYLAVKYNGGNKKDTSYDFGDIYGNSIFE